MAKTRQQHRIGLIIFVVIAAATCLLLGYWQLSRFESATGTARNLGYAFQWPAFAAFFVYAYRRFIRLEADLDAELESEGSPASEVPAEAAPAAATLAAPESKQKKKRVWVDRDKSQMTEIPEYLLPKRAASGHRDQPDMGQSVSGTPVPSAPVADVPAPAENETASASLHEYNDYLALLHERDMEGHRR